MCSISLVLIVTPHGFEVREIYSSGGYSTVAIGATVTEALQRAAILKGSSFAIDLKPAL